MNKDSDEVKVERGAEVIYGTKMEISTWDNIISVGLKEDNTVMDDTHTIYLMGKLRAVNQGEVIGFKEGGLLTISNISVLSQFSSTWQKSTGGNNLSPCS